MPGETQSHIHDTNQMKCVLGPNLRPIPSYSILIIRIATFLSTSLVLAAIRSNSLCNKHAKDKGELVS